MKKLNVQTSQYNVKLNPMLPKFSLEILGTELHGFHVEGSMLKYALELEILTIGIFHWNHKLKIKFF